MREYIPPIYLHFIFDILQFEISKDSCSGAYKLGVWIFFFVYVGEKHAVGTFFTCICEKTCRCQVGKIS